jgi:hypothetical protein
LAAAYGVSQRWAARPLIAHFTFSSSVNISGLMFGRGWWRIIDAGDAINMWVACHYLGWYHYPVIDLTYRHGGRV